MQIIMLPAPIIDSVTVQGAASESSYVTFNAWPNTYAEYAWSTGSTGGGLTSGGQTAQAEAWYNVPDTGYISVFAIDNNGCVGLADSVWLPIEPVSVEEQGTASVVQIFPNPAANNLSVAWMGEEGGPAIFELRDLLGHLVLRQRLLPNLPQQVQFRHLPAGVYLASIAGSNAAPTRLVIQR